MSLTEPVPSATPAFAHFRIFLPHTARMRG
jgi:hypothetical protein